MPVELSRHAITERPLRSAGAAGRRLRRAQAEGALVDDAKSPETFLTLVATTAKRIVELQDMNSLMRELVAAIQETFGYDFVSLLLVDHTSNELVKKQVYGLHREEHLGMTRPITNEPEGGVVGWVAYHRTPALVRDVREDSRYLESVPEVRSELAVPLQMGNKVIGVIDVESVEVEGLDEWDQFLLETLADQIAIVLENARLYDEVADARRVLQTRKEQLQRLLGRTVQLQEEERLRIAGDLHDGLVQLLVGALYQLDAARTIPERLPVGSEQALRELRSLLVQCVDEMNCIVHDLRPLVLDDLGVRSALERYAKSVNHAGQSLSVEVEGRSVRLESRVETAVYRIVQEAVANAVKHSDASAITVRLAYGADSLTVTIDDDGTGFDYDARVGGGLGLLSMEERATSIGGQLQVDTVRAIGTSVALVLPIAASSPGRGDTR